MSTVGHDPGAPTPGLRRFGEAQPGIEANSTPANEEATPLLALTERHVAIEVCRRLVRKGYPWGGAATGV
jgi:hypothetical protein